MMAKTRLNAIATVALPALAIIAIVLSLLTIGGPGQGRKEKRDQTRRADLNRIVKHVICVATRNDNIVPDTLSDSNGCEYSGRIQDPWTSQDYAYSTQSNHAFRICADFELEDQNTASANFGDYQKDFMDGCFAVTLTP